MARIRSIHPNQPTDEAFVACSFAARLLAIFVRNEADDYGIFQWKPTVLKMRLFPADNVDVGALLAELEDTEQVRRFAADGREYGAIRNFVRFQKPKYPKGHFPLPTDLRNWVGITDDVPEQTEDEPAPFPQKEEMPPLRETETDRDTKPDGGEEAPPARKDTHAKQSRGSRISPDWRASPELRDFASSLGHDPDYQESKFRDHFLGSGERKVDWDATFKNWCRREAEWVARAGPKGSGRMVHRQGPSSLVAAVREAIIETESRS